MLVEYTSVCFIDIFFSLASNQVYVLSFLFSFALSVGLGANDVANSFATSVGARVLSLRQACWIASIAEMSGALLMGGRVTSTIATSILHFSYFEYRPGLFMLGMLSSLIATSFWLFLATYLALPVSATHCIVSAIIGFGLVSQGVSSVQWSSLGKVALSWILSPLLAGILSSIVLILMHHRILKHMDALERTFHAMPLIYALTLFINMVPLIFDSILAVHSMFQSWHILPPQSTLGPFAARMAVSVLFASLLGWLCALLVRQFVVPQARQWLLQQRSYPADVIEISEHQLISSRGRQRSREEKSSVRERSSSRRGELDRVLYQFEDDLAGSSRAREHSTDSEKSNLTLSLHEYDLGTSRPMEASNQIPVENLFSFLQILTAVFSSFSHGANDVSNAIGPLVAVVTLFYHENLDAIGEGAPIWILFYGGMGLILGLAIWGKRVIETIGENLITLKPSHGFCIEIGAAMTVLAASILGLPISSTHAKVGSIISVGFTLNQLLGAGRSEPVNWKLVGRIALSWIVTIPFGCIISMLVYSFFKLFH